jgi:hypothetical protein
LPKLVELLSALPPQLISAVIKDLLKFIEAVKPEDLVLLVKILVNQLLNPEEPVDDRKLARDHSLRIISQAPQDNLVTKYLKSRLIKQLWDTLRDLAPFVVEPPEGIDVSEIPINHKFRLPDGRGNSALYPVVGMGSTKYNVLTKSDISLLNRPPTSDIFDRLFARRTEFRPHVNKVNTFVFHLATIITHDLFWTKQGDLSVNTASSYLDLQPLYGRTEDEMRQIRTGQLGQIHPDFFTSIRVSFSLPGVGALLVLFSRNHNFIAKTLLERNENGRFDSTKYSTKEDLDEELFQTARLINGGCYYNLIINDYLRVILGVPYNSEFVLDPAIVPPEYGKHYGNHISLEFNYVYRWHSAIGAEDERLLQPLIEAAQENARAPEERKLQIRDGLPIYNHKMERSIRKEHGFDDVALADEIKRSMGHIAGFPGVFNVPDALREFEKNGIEQGRHKDIHVPSLNEYRKFLRLKTYTKFEDINDNKDVSDALRSLYADVDHVELYPGLIAEQTRDRPSGGISDGTGFSYTSNSGILVDAVNLIRNDRFLTTDFTAERLTDWGYKLATKPEAAGRPSFNNSILSHLLSLLNGQFDPDDQRIKDPYRVHAIPMP